MKNIKVCPVVTRVLNEKRELLLFKHPLAGTQLVKGTFEEFDKSYELGALRELAEESGIKSVISTKYIKKWDSSFQNQIWHFVECTCNDLPNNWVFHTLDDGGHDFQFFWYTLDQEFNFECQHVFKRAIEQIRENYL